MILYQGSHGRQFLERLGRGHSGCPWRSPELRLLGMQGRFNLGSNPPPPLVVGGGSPFAMGPAKSPFFPWGFPVEAKRLIWLKAKLAGTTVGVEFNGSWLYFRIRSILRQRWSWYGLFVMATPPDICTRNHRFQKVLILESKQGNPLTKTS